MYYLSTLPGNLGLFGLVIIYFLYVFPHSLLNQYVAVNPRKFSLLVMASQRCSAVLNDFPGNNL